MKAGFRTADPQLAIFPSFRQAEEVWHNYKIWQPQVALDFFGRPQSVIKVL